MARKFIATVVMAGAALMSGALQAQDYPNRPVKVIVGFAAGSGPDVQARGVAAQLSVELGQQFYVENRPGANGTIATNAVVLSPPDGYTLMFSSASITPTPYVYKKLSYDILRDLTPIATAGILDGLLLLVNPDSPVKTVSDLIAYAKANRVLYGSPGVGNGLHLAMELFRHNTGITLDHIPYKGASEVATALLGGSIQTMFVTPTSVLPMVKEGRLRAIAYSGQKRLPDLPDVPLLSETLPDLKLSGSWGMFFAPAKTPVEIVEKLNAAIRKSLDVPTVANVTVKAGYLPDGRSAAETAAFFRSEVEAAGRAVKAAGIVSN